jgi:glycosyltransferase involved in cell wall biosynthesis
MKKRIKILIIQGYGYQRGGTVTFLQYLVKYIDKKKFEPIILFLSQGYLIDEFRSKGLMVKVINSGRLSNVIFLAITIFRIWWLIYREKIDIVFSNDCREHIYGGIAAYLAKIPRTMFWHGFFSSSFFSRTALLIPSIVFVNNKETKLAIEKQGRKAILISLGIEIPDIQIPLNKNLKSELKIEENAPIITHVSLLMSWKGQEYFIKAAKYVLKTIPNAKFLIVGGTPEGLERTYEEELHKLVNELGITKSIIFMGHRKDVIQIMRFSDIIVHPVIAPEPFGYVVIEAMAVEKPVIVSKIGTPKEIIEDGVDGILVPPRDSHAIGEAILRLLKDKKLSREMGIKGRKKVEKYFKVDRMVKKMEKIWENLFHYLKK